MWGTVWVGCTDNIFVPAIPFNISHAIHYYFLPNYGLLTFFRERDTYANLYEGKNALKTCQGLGKVAFPKTIFLNFRTKQGSCEA